MLIDRDATPEIPARFGVSAYPSILVLDPGHQNVWRWTSFKKPDAFVAEMDEALRRWDLLQQREAFDLPPPRADRLTDAGEIETWPAPADDVPCGIVALGDALFVGSGDTLFELDATTRAVRRELDVGPFQDLTTDGEHLWLLPSGWTRGDPIRVVDPATADTVREVTTDANRGGSGSSARGIAWFDGRPWVLEIGGQLHALAPDTGAVTASAATGLSWVYGLCATPSALITGSRTGLHWIDPKTLKTTRSLDTNYWIRGVGWDQDRLLCQEQPVLGFDRDHRRVRWYPDPTVVHALTLLPGAGALDGDHIVLRIVCDVAGEERPTADEAAADGELRHTLVGHRVHYELGAERYDTVPGLTRVLRALHAAHPGAVPKIDPLEGSTYGDVATAVDAVIAAGIAEVTFTGAGRR